MNKFHFIFLVFGKGSSNKGGEEAVKIILVEQNSTLNFPQKPVKYPCFFYGRYWQGNNWLNWSDVRLLT